MTIVANARDVDALHVVVFYVFPVGLILILNIGHLNFHFSLLLDLELRFQVLRHVSWIFALLNGSVHGFCLVA